MTTQTLTQAIARFDDKDHGCGARPEEIIAAEETLGVKLPSSYSWFLAQYGWLRLRGDSIYGLGVDVPGHLDLIRNTFVERNVMRPALLPGLVPIMNDGFGNHYCLDTNHMRDNECPVVLWDHERGDRQVPESIAASFDSWLFNIVTMGDPKNSAT